MSILSADSLQGRPASALAPLGEHRPQAAGQALFPGAIWQTLGHVLHLSARELQIVQLIFDDRKEQAIATELKISPHTVNTYQRRLYRKLQVSSRPQLIVRVVGTYLLTATAQRPG